MTITPSLFEAHLKCATKCWLRSTGEPAAGNAYAEWVQSQNDSYRADATKRVMEALPTDECVIAPAAENLKAAKWRLAVDVSVRIELCSSRGNEIKFPPPKSITTSRRLRRAIKFSPNGSLNPVSTPSSACRPKAGARLRSSSPTVSSSPTNSAKMTSCCGSLGSRLDL